MSTDEYAFYSGQRVSFDNGNISGVGTVTGAASAPGDNLDTVYIIKVKSSEPKLPNDAYPFTSIVVTEKYMLPD
jgi:hypothetical protein